MDQASDDKSQIGLTLAGQAAIEQLLESRLFDEQSDAYKLGIAYALAANLDLDSAPSGGYQTKFNAAGGLDKDGFVRELIEVLGVGESGRPYATAERLAELGVTAIAQRLAGSESLAEILAEVAAGDGAGDSPLADR